MEVLARFWPKIPAVSVLRGAHDPPIWEAPGEELTELTDKVCFANFVIRAPLNCRLCRLYEIPIQSDNPPFWMLIAFFEIGCLIYIDVNKNQMNAT